MNIEIPAELIEAQREYAHWSEVYRKSTEEATAADKLLEAARKRLGNARMAFHDQVNEHIQELIMPASEEG